MQEIYTRKSHLMAELLISSSLTILGGECWSWLAAETPCCPSLPFCQISYPQFPEASRQYPEPLA